MSRLWARSAIALVILIPIFVLFAGFSSQKRTSVSFSEPAARTSSRSRWQDVGQNWFSSEASSENGRKDSQTNNEDWHDFDVHMPLTTYDGGISGYSVFSNLYLISSTLIAITPDDNLSSRDIPKPRSIMSEHTSGHNNAAGEDLWRVVGEEEGREEIGKRGIRMAGVTYIFNDGPGLAHYLVYFKHFVLEAFLGATRALASTLGDAHIQADPSSILPRRVWFPRCGAEPSWRDDKGENAWFLAHVLPTAAIEDASGWKDRALVGLPVVFDKVVIIDRWSAHSIGPPDNKWGRMNAGIPRLSRAGDFWAPFRANLKHSLGLGGSKISTLGLPVVVYIDRQSANPKLEKESHDSLVEALKGLTHKAEVHVTKLSAMKKPQQVDVVNRAEIIISTHSEDCMNALWMPVTDKSTVIELFEEGAFERDWELLATSLGHRHMAVHNDHVYTKAEWEASGNVQDKGLPVRVSGHFVAGLVERILNGREEIDPDSAAY